MLCERVGRFTYVGVQLGVVISGSRRLCYQMHGSVRVEAKGATLCGHSERQERWCLVGLFDGRARTKSEFDVEQLRRHGYGVDIDEIRICYRSLIVQCQHTAKSKQQTNLTFKYGNVTWRAHLCAYKQRM